MLREEERMDIKQLHREGHSIKSICRQTGYSKNTVRKVIRGGYKTKADRKTKSSKLDEFKPFLIAKFKEGRPVPRLIDDLKKMGYQGSTSQVYRYLKPHKEEVNSASKLTVRFETAPGEQAQMDWGHCGEVLHPGGKKQKLYMFACVLSYSRMSYVELTTDMKMPTLLACHQRAFEYFGGIPEKILYDNMKQVRISPGKLNPQFLDFATYYGFSVKTCRPYRARTKGKVERTIRYFKENFLPGRQFSSLEDGNAQARHWMDYVANCRIHGTTGKKPFDLLASERLEGYSQITPYRMPEKANRRADHEGFVRFQGNRYSVPVKAAGKQVEVEHWAGNVIIRLHSMIVAEHAKPLGKGKTVAKEEHVKAMWSLTTYGNQKRPPNHRTWIWDQSVETRELSAYEAVNT